MDKEMLTEEALSKGIPKKMLAKIQEMFPPIDKDIFADILGSQEMEQFCISLKASPVQEEAKKSTLLENIRHKLMVRPDKSRHSCKKQA